MTAVVLKDRKELERDALRIEARRSEGELSESIYADLQEIIKKARAGDWSTSEKEAYAFRERHPYFQ